MTGGARVGRPAPAVLVGLYFAAALICWLVATTALVGAVLTVHAGRPALRPPLGAAAA